MGINLESIRQHDATGDEDGDGLTNLEEAQIGTSLIDADTDGDNLSDYEEVKNYGSNPLLVDSDGDDINDDVEIALGKNPNLNEAVIIVIIANNLSLH